MSGDQRAVDRPKPADVEELRQEVRRLAEHIDVLEDVVDTNARFLKNLNEGHGNLLETVGLYLRAQGEDVTLPSELKNEEEPN